MTMVHSKEFLNLLHSIEAKRPRTVIQHILRHGFITSQELKERYGYNHPPRAIRDVRERGIPVVTYRITGTDGRSIAAYKFGNPWETSSAITKSAGRTISSRALKKALIEKHGSKYFIYLELMDARLLQVDHRIPYEISRESNTSDTDMFMLLSPSANRAKSWSCEHCENWHDKSPAFCRECFWASPEKYDHIAGNRHRIISVVFTGDEIEDYNRLIQATGIDGAQNVIKKLIHDSVR